MNRTAAVAATGLLTVLSSVFVGAHAQAAAMRAGFDSVNFPANDDGSTGPVPLGFDINFFGVLSSDVYVNNNGNITIDGPLGTFTPFELTSTGSQIIAPYFGDVDTSSNSNTVMYATGVVGTRPAFGVTWANVNCYSAGTARTQRNDFQVILIDRSDTGPQNFDIEFNYERIEWETGQASGGDSNCLGGTSSARVGYSNGSGNPGTFFELPGSAAPGSFLDSGSSPLINSSLGSTELGRYVFQARNGGIVAPGKTPIGVTGGPYVGNEGLPIALNGGGSGDIDGTVVQWSWDCEDDGSYEIVTGSPTTTCTYGDDGIYSLRLLVTDDEGNQNTVSTMVVVHNVAPVNLNISGPGTGVEGTAVHFAASASDVPADPLTYTWSFADGTSGTGSSISHVYADDGTYLVQLSVSDGDGGVITGTTSVVISNVAPVITSATIPTTGLEGVAISVSATGTDVGADTLIYRWSWGDGTQVTTGATATHVYADQGAYLVTLTLVDDGGATDVRTSTVTIANVAPVILTSNFPAPGNEGAARGFSATARDVAADPLTFTWSFGDGASATGASVTHVYADNGSYAATLTVTDGDGGSATTGATVSIANVDPAIANVVIPASGGEGLPITMSANAIDAAGDAMTWVWEYGDGTSDTYSNALGSNASVTSHAYADQGTYTITITVTDGDGGVDVFNSSVITIANRNPVVSSFTAPDGAEGDLLSYAVVATDAPGDPLTYQWSFGDGGTAPGATATHVYADDGTFNVTVTIQDGDGGQTVMQRSVVITNVAPTLTSATGPATGGEGEPLQYVAVATDVGAADVPALVYTWDWGDGSTTVGATATHAWADQGSWLVTVTVDDQDGGTASQTLAVATSNVAPDITSTPVTNAIQGLLYTYQLTATEPGDDVLVWSVAPSAPSGLVIDSATGLIEFTPTYAQSQAGPYTVVVAVTDNEGGTDGQVYSLRVLSADTDGDGIEDDWELANGLDPYDPADGNLDLDLDGLTNVQEFGLNQDPSVYDGPGIPVAIFPIGGEEVDTDRPDLTVTDAVDPNGDTLTYEYRVYAQASLATLVTSMAGVPAGGGGTSWWKVAMPLNENTDYWWRARANDGHVSGGWTPAERVFINVENEAPGESMAVWPIDGAASGSVTPALEWTAAVDVDRDALTYNVEIWDEAGTTLVLSESDVVPGAGINVTWTVSTALQEDVYYLWTVQAVDEHGLEGEWSDVALFFSDGDDAAPQGVAFTNPQDGASIETQIPVLRATEGVDPEGTELTYSMEVDTVATFSSAAHRQTTLQPTGTGVIRWDLAVAGVTLPQNRWIFARVQATDGTGVSSAPDTITFFVRGENDPPGVPVLLAPEDGLADDDTTPRLVVQTPLDPEDDVVFLEFVLARDIGLDDVVLSVDQVLATGDETGWVTSEQVHGRLYWSARSVDIHGAASEWADPWLYSAPEESAAGDDDDSTTTGGGPDCGCTSSLGGAEAAPALALLLIAAPIVLRRRRR